MVALLLLFANPFVGEAGGQTMKLDAWTLLWQVINLVVLLGLLRWLLFKPLLAVIAKRQAAVAAVADQAAQTVSSLLAVLMFAMLVLVIAGGRWLAGRLRYSP